MARAFHKGQVRWFRQVSVTNDVGGTAILPEGSYKVRVTKVWCDSECGWRGHGRLLRTQDIEVSRGAGTTGFKPSDYDKYGQGHVDRTRRAMEKFDPAYVHISEHDLDPARDRHAARPRTDVDLLRGAMAGQVARKWEGVPDRYMVESLDGPMSRITDTESGRSVEVGLCDMHGAIKALKAFG